MQAKDRFLKKLINFKTFTILSIAIFFSTGLVGDDLGSKIDKYIKNLNYFSSKFIQSNEISLEEEIKNLIIYKKALYNADYINENLLLEILNPIINSQSVWKSHALYLLAEYFYSKNEKQKSKEFFSLILSLENANQDLIKEAQKRLNRDLSE